MQFFHHGPWIAISMLCLSHSGATAAENWVTLSAGERPPYIGSALPQNGYAFELVEEAFKRQSYRVNIEFVPWARAQILVAHGDVDGLLPVDSEDLKQSDKRVVYSDPFPGGVIGLLKKKSLSLPSVKADMGEPRRLLRTLVPYRIGAVRGGASLAAFDEASYLAKEMVSTDLLNLDKLSADRIQLALIDKYTAADLMVGQRPHLIGQLEFMEPPLADGSFYIAFSKARPNYLQRVRAFNRGLAEMVRDGTLEKIMNKHGLFHRRKTKGHKTQLTIGTVNNSDMVVMRNLSKEFETQHPNITLNWRVLDENTLRQRLLSDLAISDGQFDVMTIGTYEVPIWAKQGWLAPLKGLPEKYEVNDLLPTVRSAMSQEGQLFALPFYAESAMTYYRKDLFAKAGLTMPNKPSYQDIMAFASKIHDPDASIYGICLRGKAGWGENMALLSSMARSFGGRWFNEKWHPELDSPDWEKTLSYYVEALTRYGPPHADRNGFNENLALFSEGHCGIWIDATVAAGLLFDAKRSKVSERLGFVAAPTAGPHQGSGWLWSWALAIPNSSTHQKEALQFITWATSKAYIQSVAKKYGWIAVPPGTRQSTYTNENYARVAPFSRFVLDAIEGADLNPTGAKPKVYAGLQYVGIPEFPAIGNQVGLEIAKALRKEQSVKEALGKSQTFSEDQMKRSGYYK